MIVPTYEPVHNWRKEPNKKNRYKVHIRITIGPKCRYYEIATPLKVHPDEWSGKYSAWVKPTHPFAFDINNRITDTMNVLNELNKRYYNAKKSLSFSLVTAELKKDFNPEIFNQYYDHVCKNPKEKLEPKTIGRYKSALQALSRFNPSIKFFELDEALFMEVKKHLQLVEELESSTIRGYFNAYAKVIYWARLDNYISKEHQESILGDISIKVSEPVPDSLSEDEILQWKHADCSGKKKSFERDRDVFMIMIYLGIYYSDFKTLEKKELKRDPEAGYYLAGERFKGENNMALMPLWTFPDAYPLMQKYMSTDPNDPLLFDKKYFMTEPVFNRRLKIIGTDILQWKDRGQKIKNKWARATNTQLFIRYMGENTPVISKMRGHKKGSNNLKAYYAVNIGEVVAATKGLNFKEKLGI